MSLLLASLVGFVLVWVFLLALHKTLPSLESERPESSRLDEARRAYVSGEIELDEFEELVGCALADKPAPRPTNWQALDAALRSQYHGPILTYEEYSARIAAKQAETRSSAEVFAQLHRSGLLK